MRSDTTIQWLDTLTPEEQQLKDYYQTHTDPIPQEMLYSLLSRYAGSFPAAGHALAPLSDTPFLFTEQQWIPEGEPMLFSRHMAYSPESVHSHNFIEISIVYRGVCTHHFYRGREWNTSLTIRSGDVCIIPPGTVHSVAVFSDSAVINLLIRTSAMKDMLNQVLSSNNPLFYFFIQTLYGSCPPDYMLFQTENDETVKSLLVDMLTEARVVKAYYQKALSLLLGLFFTHLQREHSEHIHFSGSTDSGMDYIPAILQHMHLHYAQNIEEIASAFHLNPAYFSRLFKNHTGRTAIEILQTIRMEAATGYLLTTSMAVGDIALAVGYRDTAFFIEIFKKHYQCTPLQYRRQRQEGPCERHREA